MEKKRSKSRIGTNKFEFIAHIQLASTFLVQVPDDPISGKVNCFSLKTKNEIHYFCCDTPEDKQNWISVIDKQIVDTNEKVAFYESKKDTVASQRAEEARAIITEKYTSMRLKNQHSSSGDLTEAVALTSPTSGQRKFATLRKPLSPHQKLEHMQIAKEKTETLLKEEQLINENKKIKAEQKAADFKELTLKKYQSNSFTSANAAEFKAEKAKLIEQLKMKNSNNNNNNDDNNNNGDNKSNKTDSESSIGGVPAIAPINATFSDPIPRPSNSKLRSKLSQDNSELSSSADKAESSPEKKKSGSRRESKIKSWSLRKNKFRDIALEIHEVNKSSEWNTFDDEKEKEKSVKEKNREKSATLKMRSNSYCPPPIFGEEKSPPTSPNSPPSPTSPSAQSPQLRSWALKSRDSYVPRKKE